MHGCIASSWIVDAPWTEWKREASLSRVAGLSRLVGLCYRGCYFLWVQKWLCLFADRMGEKSVQVSGSSCHWRRSLFQSLHFALPENTIKSQPSSYKIWIIAKEYPLRCAHWVSNRKFRANSQSGESRKGAMMVPYKTPRICRGPGFTLSCATGWGRAFLLSLRASYAHL